jgi:energy-coupling factor transporter ATP-binding protein EcfA2
MYKQKMSNFIMVTGKKGSGKSYLSLRMGEILQGKTFGLNHVCFSVQELLELLDSKTLNVGDVIILEEIGVAANSRDAMTNINKSLSFAAQTIRPECITLIANTISWNLIDSQVKNLADYRIEVIGHDVRQKLSEFKFTKISPSPNSPEPYREHLIFDMDGAPIKYTSWTLKRPSKKLAEPYDEKRKEYLRNIYAKGATSIKGKPIKSSTSIKADVEQLVSKYHSRLMDKSLTIAEVSSKEGWEWNRAAKARSVAIEDVKKRFSL